MSYDWDSLVTTVFRITCAIKLYQKLIQKSCTLLHKKASNIKLPWNKYISGVCLHHNRQLINEGSGAKGLEHGVLTWYPNGINIPSG